MKAFWKIMKYLIPIGSFALDLVSDVIADRETDKLISEKVAEEISKLVKKK